jgi:lysine-N-methylase
MISSIRGKISFLQEGTIDTGSKIQPGYQIREAMIAILQNHGYPLKDRLLLTFHMLLSLKSELIITEEAIGRYRDETYLSSLACLWREVEIYSEDSLDETNELFLDIVQNYRKLDNYRDYLKDISEFGEALDINGALDRWENFKEAFGQHGQLLENCLVSKIFASCVSDDIDEMLLSFQQLVTEYVMVRYSVFLRYLTCHKDAGKSRAESAGNNAEYKAEKKPEPDYRDVRTYIVVYSRIIGYNQEGIRKFWKDSFEEAVWEFGYMLLLIN